MNLSKQYIFSRERKRWLIQTRKHENKLKRLLKNTFIKETQEIILSIDVNVNFNYDIVREVVFKKNVTNNIKNVIKDVIIFSINTTESQIKQEIKNDEFLFDLYIQEYVESEIFEQSMTYIVTNYYEDIRNIISDGIEQNLTKQEIKNNLKKELDFSDYRAERIARTETHASLNYASEKRAKSISKELGLKMYKQWIPVQDSRTRFQHASMSRAKIIPIDEDFDVGGEKMARPHDPKASAANKINCRCVLRYIPKDN